MHQQSLPLPCWARGAHGHQIETPWGVAQDVSPVAPGIAFVSTASHGGFWLSPERFAEMPEPYRSVPPFAGSRWHDGSKWYEEDCDWSIVVLAFPDLFPPGDVTMAQGIFDSWIVKRLAKGQA